MSRARRTRARRNPISSNQKLAIAGVVGLGTLAIVLLAFGGTASAATNSGAPVDPNSAQGQAAIALAAAIQAAGGYQGTQAPLVVAYETAVNAATQGLTVDAGYPGKNVMASLQNDLNNMGTNASTGATYASAYPLVFSIPTYPWTAAGGWASGNVPIGFVNSPTGWSGGSAVSQ